MRRQRTALAKPTQELKERALFSIWHFFDLINFHGGSNAFSDCHRDLVKWYDASLLDGTRNHLVLMPRGHLKSTVMVVGQTLHDIYINPNIRIFIGTSVNELSTAIVREIKTYLEDDWLIQNVWNDRPHYPGEPLIPDLDRKGRRKYADDTEADDKKIIWRADAIQVLRPDIMKEPTVTTGSVGSTSTGFHFDTLRLDDVVTYRNSNSLQKIRKVESWIYDLQSVLDPVWDDEELHDRLYNVGIAKKNRYLRKTIERYSSVGGRITVVGTRYDANDYYGYIEKNQEALGFDVYSQNLYKNGSVENGYLYPERFNAREENKLRASLSRERFYSQYMNTILSSKESVLNFANIKTLRGTDITNSNEGGLLRITREDGTVKLIKPYICVDPAATSSDTADLTAIVVGGYDDERNLYVVDLWATRESVDSWINHMYDMMDKWGLTLASIEMVAQASLLEDVIRKNYFTKRRPISIFKYIPQRVDKETRIINSLQPLIDNGMLFLTPANCNNYREVESQFITFPRKTAKDDILDAISMLSVRAVTTPKNGGSVIQVNNTLRTNSRYGGFY